MWDSSNNVCIVEMKQISTDILSDALYWYLNSDCVWWLIVLSKLAHLNIYKQLIDVVLLDEQCILFF